MNAANNVQSLGHVFEEAANMLMKGIGMLLIAIGAFEFIYFADKNMLLKEETLKVEKSETIISEEVSKVLSNSEEFVKNADEE